MALACPVGIAALYGSCAALEALLVDPSKGGAGLSPEVAIPLPPMNDDGNDDAAADDAAAADATGADATGYDADSERRAGSSCRGACRALLAGPGCSTSWRRGSVCTPPS